LPIFQDRVVGSPVIVGGLVIAQSGEGGVGKKCVAVRPGEPAKAVQPKLVYEVSGPIPYVPTPVAKGDLLFLWSDAGIVRCLDAPTGKLHWRQRVGGSYFSSPVRVGDRLYNVARDGLVVVLAASSTFAKLGESTLGEPSQSTPAVSDGVIYFRTVRHLMALGALPPLPPGEGRGERTLGKPSARRFSPPLNHRDGPDEGKQRLTQKTEEHSSPIPLTLTLSRRERGPTLGSDVPP
jgi:hypothetical protein